MELKTYRKFDSVEQMLKMCSKNRPQTFKEIVFSVTKEERNIKKEIKKLYLRGFIFKEIIFYGQKQISFYSWMDREEENGNTF